MWHTKVWQLAALLLRLLKCPARGSGCGVIMATQQRIKSMPGLQSSSALTWFLSKGFPWANSGPTGLLREL
jgi:hypothetical protein